MLVEHSNSQNVLFHTSKFYVSWQLRVSKRHCRDELECLVASWNQVEVSKCALSKLNCLLADWGQIWVYVFVLSLFFCINELLGAPCILIWLVLRSVLLKDCRDVRVSNGGVGLKLSQYLEYVAWTLQICSRTHVRSFKNALLLEDLTSHLIAFLKNPSNIAWIYCWL